MDMARRCGFHTIELSAIDGISEQIGRRARFTGIRYADRAGAAEARSANAPRCRRTATQTDEAQFARLLKKIEFAGQIGAQLVNTRCGPKARYAVFEEHVQAGGRGR